MRKYRITVDDQGRLVLPETLRKKYGLHEGAELLLEEGRDSFLINSSLDRLGRIYVEPTNSCNLDCATCIRNSWDEPLGFMTKETFAGVLEALKQCDPVPEVFFGGFGEPLSHPDLPEMIYEAKELGASVELISNGILLDEAMAGTLLELNLDRLWISIDGAKPSSYEDVRLGNELSRIISNIKKLNSLKFSNRGSKPELGITYVAMKRNIRDLPDMIRLSYELRADYFHVSNLLPHSRNMKDEILYTPEKESRQCSILFPRMDVNEINREEILALLSKYEFHELSGDEFNNPVNNCAFVKQGSVSVRQDGKIGPCLPLLHSNDHYLKDRERKGHELFFGSLDSESLLNIWAGEEYREFRSKVQDFDFSPCTSCTGCDLSDSNAEDCFGSLPVSCGGCLWAQGFIRCP
ncbi:MAG: radical SAM protein [Spirochaetales bacterium]|nr:radical SAM protein [Spirochaetales bacterium]